MADMLSPVDMASRLVNLFGFEQEFRIKDAWNDGVAHEAINEGQYVNMIRKYADKTARGVYSLPIGFIEMVEGMKAPKAKKVAPKAKAVAAAQPAAHVIPMPVQSQAVQTNSPREFGRIQSSDLAYHEIHIPEKDPSFVSFGVFQMLKNLLKSNVYAPMYIVGDSGYGKTMLVEQACAQTKRPLVVSQITNETTEDDLIGGLRIVDGDSVFEYGPVLRAYREGAVLLLDEVDQGTTSLMCLQNILQRKPYQIKKTGETIFPADGFMVIATGNTKGLGDDVEGKFVGAQLLNEALLERFTATVEQTAPLPGVEKKIILNIIDDEAFAENLVQWAGITREAAKNGTIRREIQTRRLVHICTNYLAYNDKATAIKAALGRFDSDTAEALMMLYTKIDQSVAF